MPNEITISGSAGRLISWAKVRDAVASADSDTLATFKGVHDGAGQAGGALSCLDRSLIALTARSPGLATDVVRVRILYFAADGTLQLVSDEITLSLLATKDDAGEFISAVQLELTYGFASYRVKVTSVTGTGPFDIYSGTMA